MPYTKSGVFYTAKPAGASSSAVGMRKSYGGGYMGGPKYQPGYYRGLVPTGVSRFPLRVPGRSAGAQTAAEKKYFDTEKSVVAVPESADWTATEIDPATLNTLVCPVQGAQINNRIGRKILLHKLRVRGMIVPTALPDQPDVLTPRVYRIILFQDKQTNGAQAQGEDLMKAPTGATQALACVSFQSLANLGRFKVWKDKTFSDRNAVSFNDAAATGSYVPGGTIPFKFNLNFKTPIVIHFNSSNGGAGDGDVGDIVDNSFHILANASNTANASTISYQTRAVYTDA